MIDYRIIQQLKDYDESRMTYPCAAQIKMDGIFGRFCPSADRSFYTRSGNKIIGLTRLITQLDDIAFSLDGELVIPGLDFFTMNGLIRSFNETPACKYYVFDKPEPVSSYLTRASLYKKLLPTEFYSPLVVPMKVHIINNQVEADKFYKLALSKEFEGVVYKQLQATYKDGKHWENMKRVPWKTTECTITGYYEGKGKLRGMLGGFVVDFNGRDVKVGGGPGMDYTKRTKLWQTRDECIGQPLKCRYKKLTKFGSMRSPQMLGIRWDI